jgi:photosystem II stability/assembly factor-like uncharacterized protein
MRRFSIRSLPGVSGTLALLLLAVSGTSAEQTASLGNRARLYDVVAHGPNVFAVGHPGLLLRSADRGEHFTAVAGASRDALFSIDINRAGIGAVVGRDGLVMLTKDGGATWTKTNAFASAPEGEERPHLFAVDVLEGGAMVAVGDFGVIVHSKDQGQTWERRSYSLTEAAAQPAAEEKAPAKGKKGKKDKKQKQAKGKKGKKGKKEPAPEVAAAAAEENEGFLDMSANENAGAEDEARLTAVSFADDKHGYVVGEFGLILVSNDGGITWNRQKSGVEGVLFGVQALSEKHVVAAGSDGVVLETLNGGRSWSLIPTPTKKHLFGLWASNDLVLAVGADGVAVSRGPGQTQFQAVSTNVHNWLSAITLVDGTHGVVVGGRGRVLNTKDRGQTFATSAK